MPVDALLLARRLARYPGVALLLDGTGSAPSFLACEPVASTQALDPEPNLPLAPAKSRLEQVPRWIGVLPYEACRELERPKFRPRNGEVRARPHWERPEWWRFDAVAVIGRQVTVVGESESAVRRLSERLQTPAPANPAPFGLRLAEAPEAAACHAARIARALEYIRAGDLYQVNLARRFVLQVQGHPVQLLQSLGSRAKARFAAALSFGESGVVATSPELFLSLSSTGWLTTSPIKGTRPRGREAQADRKLSEELERSPKEQAELMMVVDVERNDLGKVAVPGSVRLLGVPRVDRLPTVHHRVADVGARLRADVSRARLLQAMLPSGSVTGAPKVRAMEVIAELEAERRGLYTGAYGSLAHDGSLRLGMAIRTLTVRESEGHYFAGGGIVADSDIEQEVTETAWKARYFADLLTPDLNAALPSKTFPELPIGATQ